MKLTSKVTSEVLNRRTCESYKALLQGRSDFAINRGFRVYNGVMHTYEQKKRWVKVDETQTGPLKYHQKLK